MLRGFGLILIVGLIAGCRSQAPVYDPFLGRTTIEPPGTATQPSMPPYYTPAPGGAPTTMAPFSSPSVTPGQPMSVPGPAPMTPPPGAGGFPTSSFTPNVSTPTQPRFLPATTPVTAPNMPTGQGAPPLYQPPGGASYSPPNQPPVAPAMNWQPANRAAAAPNAVQASFTSPADRQPIRIAPPTGAPANPWTNSAAMSTQVPGGAVSGSTLNQSLNSPGSSQLVPLSTVTNSPSVNNSGVPRNNTAQPASFHAPGTTASTTGGYGYDPQYRWLKGKLEYSQSSRQWRLRYIPPENAAVDDYGGSVILADAGKLGGFQAGQFVQVQGALGQAGADQHSYAALYHVGQIQRQ